ncbi:MAG TPA: sulfotransferase [Longimicrobium sp.]|nr:sulfotransferase [Longimicrobium sp.]
MADDIRALEEALDRELPAGRLHTAPGEALLAAGRRWSAAVWAAAERAGAADLPPETVAWGRELAARPVFVVGVHRSGTTLLRDLLDGHPALSVLPSEGTWLTSLRPRLARLPAAERLPALGREWLRRLANPINQPPYWLLGRTTDAESPYVRFARALLAWEAAVGRTAGEWGPHVAVAVAYAWCTRGAAGEVRYWVEKTPTNERHLHRVRAAFPRAKVVHIVREPLAVYASHRRLEEQARGSFRARHLVLRNLAATYRLAVERMRRPQPDRHHLLRYEDLCAAPERVMGRVAAFLGIEPLPVLSQPTVAGMPAQSNTVFGDQGAPGGIHAPPREGAPALSAEERELVAALTGRLAERLGYRLPPRPGGGAPAADDDAELVSGPT